MDCNRADALSMNPLGATKVTIAQRTRKDLPRPPDEPGGWSKLAHQFRALCRFDRARHRKIPPQSPYVTRRARRRFRPRFTVGKLGVSVLSSPDTDELGRNGVSTRFVYRRCCEAAAIPPGWRRADRPLFGEPRRARPASGPLKSVGSEGARDFAATSRES